MKIETTPQLDFHNVLIRPKRTTICSRSEVDLELLEKVSIPEDEPTPA